MRGPKCCVRHSLVANGIISKEVQIMATRVSVPVTCAHCGNKFTAAVDPILDVEKDPTAKNRVLSGRVNVAVCPVCGTEGAINYPFLYHDRSKELLLYYLPQTFGRNETERQQVMGELTRLVMNSLPPEQRKAYLLQPKTYFSVQSLIETILQADGITKEMLDAQKAQVDLINTLLTASDAATFERLLNENRDKIDIGFFDVLEASIEASQLNGQARTAQVLDSLRIRLIQEFGLPVGEEIAGESSKGLLTRERLVQVLQEAKSDEELQELVGLGRPLMDYGFFQDITAQIEDAEVKGDKEHAKALGRLRTKVVAITEAMDVEAKETINKAADLVRDALKADDLDAYLREHLNEINEAFFVVLSANLQAAEKEGHADAAEKLAHVGEVALRLLQEATPPEVQLLNRLVNAAYPEETQKILTENAELVTPDLLSMMSMVVEDFVGQGRLAAADKLKKIIEQAQQVQAPAGK
jgi:hypothetical protein